jgi:protein-S-isoprenylcysteine O-methyltransferase Ste14
MIPPPLVAIIFAAAMWLISPNLPTLSQLGLMDKILVGCCVGAGLGLDLIALISFIRRRTTINPMKPENTAFLVTSGIYRHTRNPMYVGLLLNLAGWAIYLTHVLPLLLLPVFVYYLNRFQIEPEEQRLAEHFGTEFTSYRDTVPRWL